jgi:acetyltransferase-like isoleucine patch superfamily enzyme
MWENLKGFVRYRIWAWQQYPDPALVHRYGGMFALANFLKHCGSPDITRETLRRYGANIHPHAYPIGPWITVHEAVGNFANLEVGPYAHLGKEVFLDLTDKITVEESVAIGMRAIVLTHVNIGEGYPNKPTTKLIPAKRRPTTIKRGASIGAGAIICCGVTIGEDAVVNAGVMVDQDVPPRTVVSSTRHKAPFQIPDGLFKWAQLK